MTAVLVGGLLLAAGALWLASGAQRSPSGRLAGSWFEVAPKAREPRAAAVGADGVALVADLLAGCLAAGVPLPAALAAAAEASDPALATACADVAAALRQGAAAAAWRPWLEQPWLAPLARTAMRTAQSGAAAAAEFARAASRIRRRRRDEAERRVRQAAVWIVVPLGLCFLPAFVLVAVVPLVVGLIPAWG